MYACMRAHVCVCVYVSVCVPRSIELLFHLYFLLIRVKVFQNVRLEEWLNWSGQEQGGVTFAKNILINCNHYKLFTKMHCSISMLQLAYAVGLIKIVNVNKVAYVTLINTL